MPRLNLNGQSEQPPTATLFRSAALDAYVRRRQAAGKPLRIGSTLLPKFSLAGGQRLTSFAPWTALRERVRGAQAPRIPFVQQLEVTDCAAACLAMLLRYHGKYVALDAVRDAMGSGRDGANALTLLNLARGYGLRGRALQLDLADLDYLEPGAILHWEFHHFVVFERWQCDSVTIIDPASGRRQVSFAELQRAFTGVALTFEVTEQFEPAAPPPSTLWRYLKAMLGQRSVLAGVGGISLLIQLLALAMPLLTGMLVDRVIPRADYHLLLLLGLGLATMVAANALTGFLRAHWLLQLRTRLDVRMTVGFVEHLVALPYSFFQLRPTGDLLMRVNSNTTVREMLTTGAISTLLDGTLVGVYLILLFASNAVMGALVLGLGVLQMGVYALAQRRQRELMAENLQVQAKSQGYLVEMLSGIATLKASGAEQRAVEHWSNLFIDELNVALRRGRLHAVIATATGALQMGAPLVILLVGGIQVLNGQLSLGMMLALNALAAAFLSPLGSLDGHGVTTATGA